MSGDIGQIIQNMLEEVSRVRRYDIATSVPGDLLRIKYEGIKTQVLELERKYGELLKGTPEAEYLSSLMQFYGANPQELHHSQKLGLAQLNKVMYKRVLDLDDAYTRTKNALHDANILYVGELIQRSEKSLLMIKGFGYKSLRDIKEVLSKKGLELGMDVDFVRPE